VPEWEKGFYHICSMEGLYTMVGHAGGLFAEKQIFMPEKYVNRIIYEKELRTMYPPAVKISHSYFGRIRMLCWKAKENFLFSQLN
jgi:hypothetical protein